VPSGFAPLPGVLVVGVRTDSPPIIVDVQTYRFDGPGLRKRRLEAGLSLGALADAIGRSVPALVKYQNGELMPSTGTLLALCAAFGCEPGALFCAVEAQDRALVMS
jgi:hypothetical protein